MRSGFGAYRDMLVDIRDKVQSLKRQGRDLKAVVEAKPTAKYDEQWGKGVPYAGPVQRLGFLDTIAAGIDSTKAAVVDLRSFMTMVAGIVGPSESPNHISN